MGEWDESSLARTSKKFAKFVLLNLYFLLHLSFVYTVLETTGLLIVR